jgi:pimeloyl-ACP methyl ester carboxylesterase
MFRVESSDGVAVAVHEFGGAQDAPPLLLSHATGFHAHCYAPVAAHLSAHYRVLGLDHRGHGHTAAPDDWTVDWSRFGDDAVAVAEAIAPNGGLIGVGHSMGGSALLMAAARRPGVIERLILFEPIAFPPSVPRIHEMDEHPIVVGARRRRRVFASYDEAIANFSDKPPLSVMTPEVLRSYVEHGFRPVDGGVELRCSPDLEAGIFVTARDNGVWDLLDRVDIRVTVVTGHIDEQQPSGRAEDIARQLPRGGILHLPHQSHLGPFSHPDEFADLVRDLV